MNRVIHGLGWAKPPTGDATMSVTHRYETPNTKPNKGGYESQIESGGPSEAPVRKSRVLRDGRSKTTGRNLHQGCKMNRES